MHCIVTLVGSSIKLLVGPRCLPSASPRHAIHVNGYQGNEVNNLELGFENKVVTTKYHVKLLLVESTSRIVRVHATAVCNKPTTIQRI